MRAIAATLAVLLLGVGPALAKLAVTDKTMGRTTAKVEMDVHYPVTGRPALDKLFADYVRTRIAEVGQPGPDESHGVPYSVYAAYNVTRNDDRFFQVQFSVEEYSGGAHPIHFQESFTFLMPEGARTYLPELVDGRRGLERLSKLAIADLRKRLLAGPDAMTNADWIAQGASPAWLADTPFEWGTKELVLNFGEYSVAPYAAGSQEVHIPMSTIAGIIRPDPRAPMPSFDCARAAGRVEKAVCASSALARLDRQVAEAYGRKRSIGSDTKTRAAVLEGQRAWLAARDKACGTGDAACLAKSYAGRLAALKP